MNNTMQDIQSIYTIVNDLSDYTNEEKKFLDMWVNGNQYYKNIRLLYQSGNKLPVLENMYKKYDSSYDKTIFLYRGISFYKKDNDSVNTYEKIVNELKDAHKNSYKVRIDFSPSSFTLKEDVAYYFAKVNDGNYLSIVFCLEKRISNEIDTFSEKIGRRLIYKNESELLQKTHINYYFVNIDSRFDSDFCYINIKEVQ